MNEPAAPRRPPAPPAPWHGQGTVVAAVSVGGGLGACARYGAGRLWPAPEAAFPWTMLAVNAAGCALMGVLMVLITDVWPGHRLARPFLGTGVLGGFTTFSVYTQDVQGLVEDDRARTALTYMTLTVAAALAAVWLGASATRVATRAATRRRR